MPEKDPNKIVSITKGWNYRSYGSPSPEDETDPIIDAPNRRPTNQAPPDAGRPEDVSFAMDKLLELIEQNYNFIKNDVDNLLGELQKFSGTKDFLKEMLEDKLHKFLKEVEEKKFQDLEETVKQKNAHLSILQQISVLVQEDFNANVIISENFKKEVASLIRYKKDKK